MMDIYVIFMLSIVLVGNSLVFETKEKKSLMCQAASIYLNLINTANNLDAGYKFVDLKNFKLGKQIILREYLGYF